MTPSPYKRLEMKLNLALDTLKTIADAKRNSLARRLARGTVEFLEAMEAERRRKK